MENDPQKKKPKGRLWAAIGIGALALLGLGAIGSSEQSAITNTAPYEAAQVTPVEQVDSVDLGRALDQVEAKQVAEEPKVEASAAAGLSNDNYYTNVDGNRVHSPAYSLDGDVPAGASARCRDGTYSFSQNRRGTCSHHGGVADWL